MKLNKFDVVELNNKNKATILDIVKNNEFLVEIVNPDGKSLGNMVIYENDIDKVIFSKSK